MTVCERASVAAVAAELVIALPCIAARMKLFHFVVTSPASRRTAMLLLLLLRT